MRIIKWVFNIPSIPLTIIIIFIILYITIKDKGFSEFMIENELRRSDLIKEILNKYNNFLIYSNSLRNAINTIVYLIWFKYLIIHYIL